MQKKRKYIVLAVVVCIVYYLLCGSPLVLHGGEGKGLGPWDNLTLQA